MNFLKKYWLFFVFAIAGFIVAFFRLQTFSEGFATVGITKGTESASKSLILKYEYLVNKKIFKGKCGGVLFKDIKGNEGKYLVIYQKNDPGESVIVLQYPVPDSLEIGYTYDKIPVSNFDIYRSLLGF